MQKSWEIGSFFSIYLKFFRIVKKKKKLWHFVFIHLMPFSIKSSNKSEFKYFIIQQKSLKISTVLKMSRKLILDENNAEKLLTDC